MKLRCLEGSCYLPGRLYDLAFGGMFRGLRRRVAAAVEEGGLYPWLDICCGTGSQLRGLGQVERQRVGGPKRVGEADGKREGSRLVELGGGSGDAESSGGPEGRGEAPEPERPVCGLDNSFGFVRYAAARAPGVPFVCGDAGRLPFKDGSFRAVSVSFGLHDKSPDLRRAMMAEARRVLAPGGRLITVDFENPWSARSRAGALFARAVERLAGGEHYRNGREFLGHGGLRAFLRESGFVETARHDIETVSIGVVITGPDA